MGFGFQILHMIIIILIILQSSHILIADALMDDDTSKGFNVDGLQQQLPFMEESWGNENKIERVSGLDENEQKVTSIMLKFRDLLGLKSINTRTPLNGANEYPSPSPSPSPYIEAETSVPAPAPAPSRAVPKHARPPRPSTKPLSYKVHKENGDHKGRVRRILVPVLVSTGVFLLACILGVLYFCGSIRSYNKKGRIKGKSKCLSSQNPSRQVSLDPSIDLFCLNSLGASLEQQKQQVCLKQNGEAEKTLSPNHSKESDNDGSYSTREITSVHEDEESGRYCCDGSKIIPIECHSSDDESFHSFVDSHSSNPRLSNASAGSLNDTSGIPVYATTPPTRPPPPLPPLPPVLRIAPLNYCSPATTRAALKTSSSSTLLNENKPFSPRVPSNSLPSPPSIPPPPCPPPFRKGPPPPCPPPFRKGPPPPCPPPFRKGPPPPPPQLPQYSPVGKDGVPLAKLKPLHWDKVRAAPDRSMVWDKLRSSSFELDEEMIESLFGYNIHNPMKNDEAKSKTPSPSKHVLEPKRLQNITILLKALNVTSQQACNALMNGNGLVLQQLEALVKMVPTKEEEAKLNGYKGDINELGSAEKFLKVLLSLPFAFLRAQAMLYRETFDDEVIHLKTSFSMLEEACKELRSSRLFLKLLEAVLKTGNRMNIGTIRGGAIAFKLDALLKLADVKGTDGKTTLLHFVVQEIVRAEGIRVSDSIMGKINQRNKIRTAEEKEEDYRIMGLELVSGLSTELYHVKKTATVDLDVLASSVSNLSDGKAKLQHLIREELYRDEKSGNFIASMNSFLKYAEMNLKELQEDECKVLVHVREITEYFHGDASKVDEANPLRIFVIVRDFMGMLDHVCKELRNLRVPSSPSPLAPFR